MAAPGRQPKIYDLGISNEAFDSEEGYRTAITLSLFSDARARPDDVVPDPLDLRGWWADTYAAPGDSFGSRIWQLIGRPINDALLAELDTMIREALRWMVEDRLVSRLDIETQIMRSNVVGARITVWLPQQNAPVVNDVWEIDLSAS